MMNVEQERSKRRARQWLWLIGVPALMLLIGLWQWSRAPSADTASAQLAEYRVLLQELDALQARDGWSARVKDDTGASISVSLARDRVQKAIHALENSRGLGQLTRGVQKTLSTVTVILSALALLWAALGLTYQRRMGARAMRSREQLLAAFLRGKALLPVYMVVSVALLFGAAITLMVYELMPILRQQHYNRNEVKLVIVVIVFAATLLYYGVKVLIDVIRAAMRPLESDPVRVMGQIVTRAQAPKLWAFVEKVAQRIGAGVPDNIVVGLDEGFFVTENAVRLYNETSVPEGRALYLPLPYMAFMSGLEVAAVVGHELGHFVGEDTLYSQRFAPIYAAAIRHIEAVAGDDNPNDSGWRSLATRPATIFGEMFLDSFHEAVRFWSRKRELAADAVGARAAGAQSVATSLLRIVALEPRVNEALAAQWDTGQTVAGGVLGHVRQLVAAKGMDNPAEHLHNRQPHPFDSHPEVAERLQAVGLPVNDELLRRAMDPTPSKLLQQLGLEAAAPTAQTPAPGDAAQAAAAPVSDINAALQTELASAAAANRQEKIQALTELVRAAQTSQPVAERVWLLLLGSAALTLCALLAGIALLMDKSSGTPLAGLAALTVGAAGLGWSVSVFRRGRRPALVIRPEGLQLFDQPTVLSWESINDFGFTETNYTFVVRMELDAQTPALSLGVSRLRGVYFKTKRQLQITLLGLGGKRADKVMNTMVNYWRAYHARVELQRMGVGIR